MTLQLFILRVGYGRCSEECLARWASSDYKFPPYQFKEQYILWDSKLHQARLLSANERERLLGYGSGHTLVCYSASEVKQNKTRFEESANHFWVTPFLFYHLLILLHVPWLIG